LATANSFTKLKWGKVDDGKVQESPRERRKISYNFLPQLESYQECAAGWHFWKVRPQPSSVWSFVKYAKMLHARQSKYDVNGPCLTKVKFKLPAQIMAKIPAIFPANVIDMDKQGDQCNLIFIHETQKSQGALFGKSFWLNFFRPVLQLGYFSIF
jgi:hypothetical protein